MNLLMENWRKFVNESYTDWGSIGLDQVSEDDLYDLDYDELMDLQDYIESGGSDPKDLLSTVNARIDAIEEEDMEGIKPPPDRKIEGLYDGEFAMKLLKMFFSTANQGIELAAMVGAESLSKEFRRIRGHVTRLIKYAEDGDNYPWLTLDETEEHPDVLTNDVRMLLKQMMGTAFENEMDEEQKEVISGYHNWIDSMDNLNKYAYYNLHQKTAAQRQTMQRGHTTTGFDKYEHAYEFIKDWVGGE